MKRVTHFIGIGGVGMAPLAHLLIAQGNNVRGSDLKENSSTKRLQSLGTKIFFTHKASNISENISEIIYSNAIPSENPELIEAQKRGILCTKRGELLARMMDQYVGISVTGSHGKTTTSVMLTTILKFANLDPTAIFGGIVPSWSGGMRYGLGKYFIAEGDESDESFLLSSPKYLVLTNIDKEHLKYYGSMEALESKMLVHLKEVASCGTVICSADDKMSSRLVNRVKGRLIRCGFDPLAEFSANNVEEDFCKTNFELIHHGKSLGRFFLPMMGKHMVHNALLSIGLASELGIEPVEAAEGLSHYPGVRRRLEIIYQTDEIMVFDDYAHHPVEIDATLEAIRNSCLSSPDSKWQNLICIIQPHRYSRVEELFDEFCQCASFADEVIITDVFSAGEEIIRGCDSRNLAKEFIHPKVRYMSLNSALEKCFESCGRPKIVIVCGAGDISSVARKKAATLQGTVFKRSL